MTADHRAAIVATLRAMPHFRLLRKELIVAVGEGCALRTFESGQPIFFERDECRAFFAVRQGAVKLYRLRPDGHEQVVNYLHPVQSFAEAALLSMGRYPVNAAAIESPTELLEINGEHLRNLMKNEEGMAAAMVGSLSMRLLDLVERIDELSIANAAGRLARHLLRLPGEGPPDQQTVELPVTKKDLAARLSIAPETLSRLLRKWQDDRLILSNGRRITILDAARLLHFADGDDPA